MARYKVEFSKQANTRFLQIVNYLSENWSVKVAIAFQTTLFEKLGKIAENPKLGKPSVKNKGFRSILITEHNRAYSKITGKIIYIITIFDTRQNPSKNKFE